MVAARPDYPDLPIPRQCQAGARRRRPGPSTACPIRPALVRRCAREDLQLRVGSGLRPRPGSCWA